MVRFNRTPFFNRRITVNGINVKVTIEICGSETQAGVLTRKTAEAHMHSTTMDELEILAKVTEACLKKAISDKRGVSVSLECCK